MLLITKEQRSRLLRNGSRTSRRRGRGESDIDFKPVVKLFCPWAAGTWLLTELDPGEPDIAFGLCDLGMGFPELGNVRISELESLNGPLGLRIERDRHFVAVKSLGAYTDEAIAHQRIKA